MTQRTGGRATLAQWTQTFGHALAAQWTTIDREQSAPVMAAVGAAVQHSPWRTALRTGPLAAVIFAATSRTLQRPPATAIKTAGEWCEVALTLNGRLADLVVAGIVRDCVGANPAMMDLQAAEELHGVAELAEIAAARAALDARQQAITAQLLRIAQGDTP